MWIIIAWDNENQSDATVIVEPEGDAARYHTLPAAKEWAEENLNSHYKIVCLVN